MDKLQIVIIIHDLRRQKKKNIKIKTIILYKRIGKYKNFIYIKDRKAR